MLVLGIDTSTKVAGAALVNDNQVLGEHFLHTGNDHSGQLMPMVEALFKLAGKTPNQLSGVAIAMGPGSFTGLRIGLATGKALASALSIPLVGVPTLDALAHNLAGAEGLICPILDARKEQLYTAIYTWEENKMIRLSDYMVLTPGELGAKLTEYASFRKVTLAGDGVKAYGQELVDLARELQVVFAYHPNSLARGSQVAWLGKEQLAGAEATGQDYHGLTPMYLRVSEAEAKLQEKLAQEVEQRKLVEQGAEK